MPAESAFSPLEAALSLVAVLFGLVAWFARQLYGRMTKDLEELERETRELRERLLRLEVQSGQPVRWRDAVEAIREEWVRLQDEWPR